MFIVLVSPLTTTKLIGIVFFSMSCTNKPYHEKWSLCENLIRLNKIREKS